MILATDFFDHWKTKALIELSQHPESPLWVQRLWAHCQMSKSWTFTLPPLALKSICSVPADISPAKWFGWLVECRFITGTEKKWRVNDWELYNAALVKNWVNGGKPKKNPATSQAEAKVKPAPSEAHPNGKQNDLSLPLGGGDRRMDGLRMDGGKESNPKPLRRAKVMGILPSEQDEPWATRMGQVNALKHRQASTRWSSKEVDAFRAAGLDAMSDFDFAEQYAPLAAFYAAEVSSLQAFWDVPAGRPEADYRRRDLETLLNNWGRELDRARAWVAWKEKKAAAAAAGQL